jgi:hypothetical protein
MRIKRNRDDLLINPINKDGKFENVYLNDFLKREIYMKKYKNQFLKIQEINLLLYIKIMQNLI